MSRRFGVLCLLSLFLVSPVAGASELWWMENPLSFTAIAPKLFRQDLTRYVYSSPQHELTFELRSGPAWLTVSPRGILQGTPSLNDLGSQKAVLTVADGEGTSEATVELEVEPLMP